jgi:hypothetical protein
MIQPTPQDKLRILDMWLSVSAVPDGTKAKYTADMMAKHMAKSLRRDPEDIKNIINLCYKEMNQGNKTPQQYMLDLRDTCQEIPQIIANIVNTKDPAKAKKFLDKLAIPLEKYSDEDKASDEETLNGLVTAIRSDEVRAQLRSNDQLRKDLWAIIRYQ